MWGVNALERSNDNNGFHELSLIKKKKRTFSWKLMHSGGVQRLWAECSNYSWSLTSLWLSLTQGVVECLYDTQSWFVCNIIQFFTYSAMNEPQFGERPVSDAIWMPMKGLGGIHECLLLMCGLLRHKSDYTVTLWGLAFLMGLSHNKFP